MRLMIYETTHHETLPAMLDLASQEAEQTTVYLYASSYQHLCSRMRPEEKWPGVRFVTRKPEQSNRGFIRSCFAEMDSSGHTHFHISTLDHNLLYFAFLLLSRPSLLVSLSVQAIREYLAWKGNDLRDISEALAKLYLHRRIRDYRVFSPAMAAYFEQKRPAARARFIPPRFFTGERTAAAERDFFKIVIPGSLDPIRRNYELVPLYMQRLLLAGTLPKTTELVILGNANNDLGRRTIAELKAIPSDRFRLKYYPEYVNPQEYEDQLRDADLIWSPIQLDTKGIRNTPERYGLSTATGLTGDLLMTACPALVPAGFIIPDHMENILFSYHSEEEFAARVHSFMAQGHQAIRPAMLQDLTYFQKENFSGAFRELFRLDPAAPGV